MADERQASGGARLGLFFDTRDNSINAQRGWLVTPNGLLGFVAFLNTTTVNNADDHVRLFDNFAPAAGSGLRVLLNKHARTNLTADYGWGKEGSRGLDLGIQEAF